jgi:hypothetical protein
MSNADWFARKLNVPQQPQQQTPPSYMPQAPQQPYVPQQPSYPVATPAVPMGERCPGCGSGNYGGATPESRKRCYDCGYPITQSGSGMGTGIMGGGQASGPAIPATQVQAGGWNPTTIIGKI